MYWSPYLWTVSHLATHIKTYNSLLLKHKFNFKFPSSFGLHCYFCSFIMKQRLVLRFDTFYDDYNIRSKAMRTVVGADGVTSVMLDEKDESKMVVIGEEMDAYGLLNILKKRNFKAHMEKLEEIEHEKKEHHAKEKKKEHHKEEEKEEKKHNKDRKKKKEKKEKKKHGRSDSDSGSGSTSSSGSHSDSDSDKKKRDHHHNRQTHLYRPTYRPQAYPAPAPYDNGYNYKNPANRYPEGYNQEGCSIM